MDNLGIIDGNMSHNNQLTISPDIVNFLRETAKWAKFLSIVGFVMMGLFVIMGVFFSAMIGGMGGAAAGLGGGFLGLVYVAMAALYFFPILYLYRFSTQIKTAIDNNDQGFLSSAFSNLKSCYKFLGILMAIILGFYAFMLVIGLLFGGMAAFF